MRSWLILVAPFIVLELALAAANHSREQRHRQLGSPLAALVVLIAFFAARDSVYPELRQVVALPARWMGDAVVQAGGTPSPELDSATVLLAIGIAFLVAKLIARAFALRRTGGEPSLAYASDGGNGSVLRPEWVVPGRLLLAMGWGASALYAFELAQLVADRPIAPMPVFLWLSALVLLEAGWYLGGRVPEPVIEDPIGDDPRLTEDRFVEGLWELYQRIWPAHILAASSRFRLVKPAESPALDDVATDNAEVLAMWRTVSHHAAGGELGERYYQLLARLWRRESVLVSAALHDRFAPVLFGALQWDLTNGHRIFVLVDAPSVVAPQAFDPTLEERAPAVVMWMVEWFERLFAHAGQWRIETLDDAERERVPPNVLVATAADLIRRGAAAESMLSEVRTLLVLDATTTVLDELLPVAAVAESLRDNAREAAARGERLRVIALTDDRRRVESSVRQTLAVESLTEDRLARDPSAPLFAIVWRAEDEPMQRALLDVDPFLGDDAMLAVPAWARGVKRIRMVGQQRRPIAEDLEELRKGGPRLRAGGILSQPEQAREIDHVVQYDLDAAWLVPLEPFAFVIAHDRLANCIETLRQWSAHGLEVTFVHVVSPPYLLRDYLADNADWFLSNPILALAPMTNARSRNVAFRLAQRLIAAPLPEAVVRHALDSLRTEWRSIRPDAQFEDLPVEHLLAEMYRAVLGIDILASGYLHVTTADVFVGDGDNPHFEIETRFALSSAIRNEPALRWMQTCSIIDTARNVLGTVLLDRLYQTYLPHQIHAFGGKPFEIRRIHVAAGNPWNEGANFVHVNHAPPAGRLAYRPHLALDWQPASFRQYDAVRPQQIGGWTVWPRLGEMAFTVGTPGFFAFTNGLRLDPVHCRYHILTDDDAVPVRAYPDGRALRLTFRPGTEGRIPGAGNGEGVHLDAGTARRIGFTLAVLVREIAPTLFPETHRLLLAAEVAPATAAPPPRSGSATSGRDDVPFVLSELHPTLYDIPATGFDDAKAPVIDIVFLEDCQTDAGLVRILAEEWEDVFQLLYDVLHWTLEEQPGDEDFGTWQPSRWRRQVRDHLAFLRFGQPELDPRLALRETMAFLAQLFPPDANRYFVGRRDFVELLGQEAPYYPIDEVKHCDFCGLRLPETDWDHLRDGRMRCAECRRTSLDGPSDIEAVYREARGYFEGLMELDLRRDVEVRIAEAAEIAAARGEAYVPSHGWDPRTIGLAMLRDGQATILIENGRPRDLTYAVMVHELAHVWQWQHLDTEAMRREHGELLIEGHATWAEIDALRQTGRIPDYQRRERERTDVYGEGCRTIERMLEGQGRARDAFRMLLDLYPAPGAHAKAPEA